jgi:hypothetical protein
MKLPGSSHLPINLLSNCFRYKSATYKYYWFLSVLDALEKSNSRIIAKRRIFSGMIAHSWYTVNYFHLSFGQQDKIESAIKLIKEVEPISIDEKKDVVVERLMISRRKDTLQALNHFDDEVPYRFLSPWFPGESDDKRIYAASQRFENKVLYGLYKDYIEINPEWEEYLRIHSAILKAFCFWNLAIFLQSKNPSVPDIPNKLFREPIRKNLIKQREFWNLVMELDGPQDCIYTGNKLVKGEFSVDHFIPHAFVSHDLIWNLIPVDITANLAKGDGIPQKTYLHSFVNQQLKGIEIVRKVRPKNKCLEDYLTILPDLSDIRDFSSEAIKNRFKQVVEPLITIALNNGFRYMRDPITTSVTS